MELKVIRCYEIPYEKNTNDFKLCGSTGEEAVIIEERKESK